MLDLLARYRARALGLRLTMWDIDPYDWRRPGAGVIAGRVLSRVHAGGGDRSPDGGRPPAGAGLAVGPRFWFRALCQG